ncbi:MAG: hypothetical protein ACI9VS_002176 [Candidatus Binatia bacterium]|jgi:hypothetical protein
MNFEKAVDNIGTVNELKRIASAYVIDYRGLSEDEIKEALKKTAPQYYFQANVEKAIKECNLNADRENRTLSPLFLKHTVLHKDHFMCSKRETETDIITWEQSIIDRSNEDLFKSGSEKCKNLEFFKFVLETAWEHNDAISPDEKNLIEKIRFKLNITETEYRILEAKLAKFPKPGNQAHSHGEIDETRRLLQSKGLLFAVRDADGTDYDVIPDEIADTLRNVFGVEMRRHGYREMIKHKHVRSKAHLAETLKKCEMSPDPYASSEQLQELCIEQVRPSVLLGGISPKDGLPMGTLSKWCGELNLNISGVKSEKIERIIKFYDTLLEREETGEDERAVWYKYFEKFASREIGFLRGQQLIEKDLEIEKKFEEATRYLFEQKFNHKPLTQVGSNHPDGLISFRDALILWDNKSKETCVNLKDHLKQFDGYVRAAEKRVACFLVIGPDFTPESGVLAMQYQVENSVTITLITAEELKNLAENWCQRQKDKGESSFPLGYLIQPGRFRPDLVAAF